MTKRLEWVKYKIKHLLEDCSIYGNHSRHVQGANLEKWIVLLICVEILLSVLHFKADFIFKADQSLKDFQAWKRKESGMLKKDEAVGFG